MESYDILFCYTGANEAETYCLKQIPDDYEHPGFQSRTPIKKSTTLTFDHRSHIWIV